MSDSKAPPSAASADSEPATAVQEGAPTSPAVPREGPASPPPPKKPEPPSDGDGDDDDKEERELGGKMTFLEHLDELRKRILYSVASLVVGFTASWIYREEIYAFIERPIKGVVDTLYVMKPTEPFTIYLKTSFVAALFLAIPVILFQIWMFISPGLYRKEKRFVLPFLLASTFLFISGGAFAYYIVMPPALNFLLNEFGANFAKVITAVEYFDFAILILVGMGAIFQLPVLVAFLSLFGLVTPRFLIKNFRYAFLLIVIVAAVVSPTTDPFNLFLWSGPMVILYAVSIVVSWVFQRRRQKRG